MPELGITVGLPASGKSTLCKQLMRAGYVIVNIDKIRLALHGEQYAIKAEGFVWATAEVMARTLLSQGHNVVIDATNTTQNARSQWKRLAAEFNTKMDIYCMQTPIDVCKERNAARRVGQVPDEVITRMARQFQNPTDDEGVVRVVSEATEYV